MDHCLTSLQVGDPPDKEVIVVDNGSQDGSGETVAERYKQVNMICNDRNEYFTKACNQGIERSK